MIAASSYREKLRRVALKAATTVVSTREIGIQDTTLRAGDHLETPDIVLKSTSILALGSIGDKIGTVEESLSP